MPQNDFNSGTRTVACGIPQIECLGLLLFTIYLNKFENCLIDSRDTHITVTSTNVENLIQEA